MKEGAFRNRLDLLIRLQDTTTGIVVGGLSVSFYLNGQMLHPSYRGDGNYILINQGRENGLMRIEAYGFELFEAVLDYDQLDERLPTLDAFLIPSESMHPGQRFLTITGSLPGLSSIEAVHLARPLSGLREFDPKKRVMTVYMPNRRMNMVHTYYGLVNTAEQTFEDIVVLEELNDRKIRLKEPLQGQFPQNAPICRLIFGQVREDGSYMLRVRNTGRNLKHLVRFVADGQADYRIIDFAGEIPSEEGEEV